MYSSQPTSSALDKAEPLRPELGREVCHLVEVDSDLRVERVVQEQDEITEQLHERCLIEDGRCGRTGFELVGEDVDDVCSSSGVYPDDGTTDRSD